jgi:hypothetical protein
MFVGLQTRLTKNFPKNILRRSRTGHIIHRENAGETLSDDDGRYQIRQDQGIRLLLFAGPNRHKWELTQPIVDITTN